MRIVITLDELERLALGAMSRLELRRPRDQVRALIREAAARRGLLPALDSEDETDETNAPHATRAPEHGAA